MATETNTATNSYHRFRHKKQNTNATNLTFRLELNTADDITQLSVELA